MIDELDFLGDDDADHDDDVDLATLRRRAKRAAAERAKRRRQAQGRPWPRVSLPGGAVAGVHATRPWWRWDGRRWLRTDRQTWPARPAGVLEQELERLDREIALRGPARWSTSGPVPESRWRRVPHAAAAGPLLALRKLGHLQRRLATAERDARAHPNKRPAAEWAARLVERQREVVRELPVGVPWGGVIVGRGVAP